MTDNKDWVGLYYETRGKSSTEQMWLLNTKTNERALFKPDSRLSSGKAEVAFSKLATSLGVNCAQAELFTWRGDNGFISYDFKIADGRQYSPSSKFNINTAGDVFTLTAQGDKKPIGITMEMIRKNIPEIEKDTVDMLFLDCLTKNIDRHSGNIEVMKDSAGNVLGIAPLFDHGLTIWNERVMKTPVDKCLFRWNSVEEPQRHFEIFGRLSRDY